MLEEAVELVNDIEREIKEFYKEIKKPATAM